MNNFFATLKAPTITTRTKNKHECLLLFDTLLFRAVHKEEEEKKSKRLIQEIEKGEKKYSSCLSLFIIFSFPKIKLKQSRAFIFLTLPL